MSISNLTGFGDNKKLYIVEIRMYLESRDVFIYIYSTNKISSRIELINFLMKQPSNTIGVFGRGYQYNNTKVLVPCALRYSADTNTIYFSYYMDDETGYKNISLPNVSFSNTEV